MLDIPKPRLFRQQITNNKIILTLRYYENLCKFTRIKRCRLSIEFYKCIT